jgi:hypothetical protein
MTVVVLVGASIGIPGLAEDEDVVTLAEGVGVESNGAKVDIGVVTGGLVGGGTIEVPLGELIDTRDGLEQSLCLGASATVGINPNVFSLDATTLVEIHVLHEIPRVGDDSCRFGRHSEYVICGFKTKFSSDDFKRGSRRKVNRDLEKKSKLNMDGKIQRRRE